MAIIKDTAIIKYGGTTRYNIIDAYLNTETNEVYMLEKDRTKKAYWVETNTGIIINQEAIKDYKEARDKFKKFIQELKMQKTFYQASFSSGLLK